MKSTAWFDIACNDPDNGSFAGKTNAIQYRVGNDLIELEADTWDGYKFTDASGWIRIHRRKFEIIGGKDWVGNWCWNGFKMERSEAKRFLGALKTSGCWRCTHGPSRWFDWFNGPEPAHHDAQVVSALPIEPPDYPSIQRNSDGG